MIFLFDTSLMNKSNAKQLADALKLICLGKHKVDYNDPKVWEFIENEVLTTSNLGKIDIDLINGNQNMRDVRNIDRNYLSTLEIGTASGMTDLTTLSVILNESSCVVLENSHYDWCPLKAWVASVKNDRDYKEINTKVSHAIDEKRIKPEHSGGSGGIKNKIRDLKRDTYHATAPYKITTLFDSDKESATDTNEHNDSLKDFLNEEGYFYHEWDRREIENYIPLSVYEYAGLVNQGVTKPSLLPNDWNFTNIGEHPYFKGKYKKKMMEVLAQYIDKSATKEAFADKNYVNPVDNRPVTELQYVIFHLAKYI